MEQMLNNCLKFLISSLITTTKQFLRFICTACTMDSMKGSSVSCGQKKCPTKTFSAWAFITICPVGWCRSNLRKMTRAAIGCHRAIITEITTRATLTDETTPTSMTDSHSKSGKEMDLKKVTPSRRRRRTRATRQT